MADNFLFRDQQENTLRWIPIVLPVNGFQTIDREPCFRAILGIHPKIPMRVKNADVGAVSRRIAVDGGKGGGAVFRAEQGISLWREGLPF